MSETFDDFLGLARREFSRHRLVIFRGASGSGKSTAIRFLLDRHPDFRGKSVFVARAPFAGLRPVDADLVVIDEIATAADLRACAPLFGSRGTILVATHISPLVVRRFRPFARTSVFLTDADRGKIGRCLERKGIASSEAAVAAFVRDYGASYPLVDAVLEARPGANFDRALEWFRRFRRFE